MALNRASKEDLQGACPTIVLGDKLGEGGNAQVYAGISPDHGDVAVKFMLNDNTKRYGRFRDEVLVVTTRLNGSPRVVPILESHLPDEARPPDIPWYVMPRAQKLSALHPSATWQQKLAGLIDLADGLAEIHGQDVAHRDIKPANLLELDGTPWFADFGIAAFPENAGLTEKNDPMGPAAGFMAPEMMADHENADPMKADVYSFSKTVWSVLTDKKRGFMGHYTAKGPYGLAQAAPQRLTGFIAEPLDSLLDRSTDPDPARRPTASEFAKLLLDVAEVQEDWDRANILQWTAAEREVLLTPGLSRAVWEGAASIATVMHTLSRRRGLNHLFFPEGGGFSVIGATTCEGENLLLLDLGYSGLVVAKPRRLTLEQFPDAPTVGYAVLETDDIQPLGAPPRYAMPEYEHLKRVNDFDYVVDDSDEDEPKNRGIGIPCARYYKGGVFVLASTRGLYNQIDDYDGTATKLGRDRLRERFEAILARERRPQPGFQLQRIVRLLAKADASAGAFELQHLSMEQFEELVRLDDKLLEERSSGGPGLILDLAELHRAAMRGPTDTAKEARRFIRMLTAEQRGEYLALVYIGRGSRSPSDLAEETAANAEDTFDESYLMEKLGNGYMRKVLGKFGMAVQAAAK